MSKISVGVCEWALPCQGPYSVRLASELGFEGLQLADLGGYTFQYPMNDPHIQAAYLEYAEAYRQTLASLHMRSLFQDKTVLFPQGSAQSDQAKLTIKRDILVCAEMGIPTAMGTVIVPPGDEAAFLNAAAHIEFACEYAGELGVTFALETNLTNEGIWRMRELVGDKLKICFDTCNPYIYNVGIPQQMLRGMLVRTPEMIEHYHVKDTLKEDFLCGHAAPCRTGKGDSNLAETARMVRASGFSGWVYSEVYYHARPLNNAGDFVRLAREDATAIKEFFQT